MYDIHTIDQRIPQASQNPYIEVMGGGYGHSFVLSRPRNSDAGIWISSHASFKVDKGCCGRLGLGGRRIGESLHKWTAFEINPKNLIVL